MGARVNYKDFFSVEIGKGFSEGNKTRRDWESRRIGVRKKVRRFNKITSSVFVNMDKTPKVSCFVKGSFFYS
jgi:hypothetical protein